ncbi:MAG: DNA-directed RNA polymerase subunit delta [Bacillota bacterium]
MQQGGDELARMSEADLAYQVLKQNGQPKYYKDLIVDVLTTKGRGVTDPQGTLISGVYTQITMDSRFVHLGKGIWGLAEWYPQRGISRLVEVSSDAKGKSSLERDRALLAEIQDTYGREQDGYSFPEKFEETD